MTLAVANRMISRRADISEVGRLVLAFIDGGMEWLDWAMLEPASSYAFPDETVLVEGVQTGLHASRLVLLPHLKLVLSPTKLMTLGAEDLRVLARNETGSGGAQLMTQYRHLKRRHGLRSQNDFEQGLHFLDQDLGVAAHPIFQCLSFDDVAALDGLLQWAGGAGADGELQREAAAFAVATGRTPVEFADYFRLYVQHSAKLGAKASSPEARRRLADTAVETLAPMMFAALDCPSIGGIVPPPDVAAAINSWLINGLRLGFTRLSLGIQQVVENTNFTTESGAKAEAFVGGLLKAAQHVLAHSPVKSGVMAQDGGACFFRVAAGEHWAEVKLSHSGLITLNAFGARGRHPHAETSSSEIDQSEMENAT